MKENKIFDIMPLQDFTLLRKIIGMILATNMSNHFKVMSLIKAQITELLNEQNDCNGFKLIPKEESNPFEIQQSLLDFLISCR